MGQKECKHIVDIKDTYMKTISYCTLCGKILDIQTHLTTTCNTPDMRPTHAGLGNGLDNGLNMREYKDE